MQVLEMIKAIATPKAKAPKTQLQPRHPNHLSRWRNKAEALLLKSKNGTKYFDRRERRLVAKYKAWQAAQQNETNAKVGASS